MGEGICDICGDAGRLHSCMLCGRRVCLACYAGDKGVCKICLRGMKYKGMEVKGYNAIKECNTTRTVCNKVRTEIG